MVLFVLDKDNMLPLQSETFEKMSKTQNDNRFDFIFLPS